MTDEKKDIYIKEKDVWEKQKEVQAEVDKKESEKSKLPIEDREAIKQELLREIEMLNLSPELEDEAVEKAKKIEFLGEKEKLAHLLNVARERGLEFAVKMARNMNDPYILDVFHDLLIKEGLFKKFSK
ncbi:hypothetical protein KKG36_01960 [Patescibacteria group bacterium]|nr:hypothetical protein [Patescibacteria group bacterium]